MSAYPKCRVAAARRRWSYTLQNADGSLVTCAGICRRLELGSCHRWYTWDGKPGQRFKVIRAELM